MFKPASQLVEVRADGAARVAHQFVDADQQHSAAELGMWLFLATEIMFFGAFFLAYLVYREWYPVAFAMGSRQMDVMLGTVNTGVLLTSSLTMALAVRASEMSQRRWMIGLLVATLLLGMVFLGIKGLEYYHKYAEHLVPFAGWTFAPAGEQRTGMMEFFNLYFLMTGLHALHMVAGLVMLALLVIVACRSPLRDSSSIVVHNVGLYWHFVDLVWVYLFPFFYLVSASGSVAM
ncbi:MAG: cytochrome c oxidase subunit [Planctomycetaceae bacterium]|nr:cytochrome c oxidase subunit [Planctomycetaceae bacterium]